MTPVIRHLHAKFANLPAECAPQSIWTFKKSIQNLDTRFYSELIPLIPILNLEYSILCQQLRHNFSFPEQLKHDDIVEQLTTALMLAELLEHVHLYYLIVPREVVRLRKQQKLYKEVLIELDRDSFVFQTNTDKSINVGLSLTQQIRENTVFYNWYRILLIRGKRLLNVIDMIRVGSGRLHNFVVIMDKFANPFLAYFSWCFFIPRLFTNLFLVLKHTIAGPWMNEEEAGVSWHIRLLAQLQRRWFELGNDGVWFAVGIINCFVLIGALAPFAIYLTIAAFSFDVINSGLRAFIELRRLYQLQSDYEAMLHAEVNESDKDAITEYLHALDKRMTFEQLRLGLTVANTCAVLIATCCSIPALALISPLIPLIGVIGLLLALVVTFSLTRELENLRPQDVVEKPSGLAQWGLFAKKTLSAPIQEVALDTSLDNVNCN